MDITTPAAEHTVYFAYGSNLDIEQMSERCPDAQRIGAAALDGWRFEIGGRGYATIRSDDSATVWGGLWTLTTPDEAALDVCEGVRSGTYRKEILTVELDGSPLKVLVYVENSSDVGRPTPQYLDRILRGADQFGLPPEHIDFLRGWAA
jgi:gamma-glutamylcyclotransferase (GGCT)/AIG2-like uncharacterized protein YtfP